MYKRIAVFPFLIIFFLSCNSLSPEEKTDNNNVAEKDTTEVLHVIPEDDYKLSVKVSASDTIDPESDANYGEGDDDLFTADDFAVYKIKTGEHINVSDQLNDYNLITALRNSFATDRPDTFLLIINFPGLLPKSTIDTNIIINRIHVFNGNRESVADHRKYGAAKNVAVYNNNRLIGEAILENTYKRQSVLLDKTPVINLRGATDTIKLIVRTIYQGNVKADSYDLSEIKLDGIRAY